MRLLDVVLPTLVVVASWACIGALIAGVGYVTRRVLVALANRTAEMPWPADVWIGLATLIAFLQLWSLVAAITWESWIAPIALALAGIVLAAGKVRGCRGVRPSIGVMALLSLAILWLANQSLAPDLEYDLGLYHFASIEYASQFGTVPGLGNLHHRLGAGNAHFLFVAFLGHGPWSRIGFHLANGFMVSALFVDVALRFVRRRRLSPSFTRRMALLLVPATIVAIVSGTGNRLNAPDLDLAVFVLVVVGVLYLAECVEFGFRSAAAFACVSSLALAAATRPLYWPLTAVAATLVVLTTGAHPTGQRGLLRVTSAMTLLPAGLLVGWMMRQLVLSGYPLFPLTTGGLPVDWRMPAAVVSDFDRVVRAWPRWPGKNPDDVLASWDWLHPWLRKRLTDVNVVAPALFLSCLVPALLRRSPGELRRRREWRLPMLCVVLPAAATLVAWFLTAPDTRFALAPIWLTSIALVAWALPTAEGRDPGRGTWARTTAYAILGSALLVTVGAAAEQGVFRPIVSDRAGPVGTQPVPIPALVPYQTRSGLRLSRPVHGQQCRRVILCTPYLDANLRLRGHTIGEGLRLSGQGSSSTVSSAPTHEETGWCWPRSPERRAGWRRCGRSPVAPSSRRPAAAGALRSLAERGLVRRERQWVAAGRARELEIVRANVTAPGWAALALRLAAVRSSRSRLPHGAAAKKARRRPVFCPSPERHSDRAEVLLTTANGRLPPHGPDDLPEYALGDYG